MIAVYAATLLAGGSLLGWLVVAEPKASETRMRKARRAISALMAFGLGGLSASYGGLPGVMPEVLAVVAAVAFVAYGERSYDADSQ